MSNTIKPSRNHCHPGIELKDMFNSPAVYLRNWAERTVYETHYDTTIVQEYNSYGYRTHEFDSIDGEYFLALGDSQTEGVGLHSGMRYTDRLERILKIPGINLGIRQCSPDFISQNVSNWISSEFHLPNFIVIQWPSMTRMMFYGKENLLEFQNPNYGNKIYHQMIKINPSNLISNWISSVINTNRLLNKVGVTCVNMFLEQFSSLRDVHQVLESSNIKIHYDDLTSTSQWDRWMFDRGAYDRAHHSGEANQQWAERIEKIIKNENTTR